MKKTLLLSIFFLVSCKTPQQLIDKAVKKQPDILRQFDTVISVPRITIDTLYYADTFELVKSITIHDTIISVREIAPKSKYDYKAERDDLRAFLKMERINLRKYKDSLSHARKTSKIEYRTIKVQEKTKRRKKVVWLLLGIGIGFIFRWIFIIFINFIKLPIDKR